MTTDDTTAPMTTTETLADGYPATSLLTTTPRVECSATTDPEAINTAMEKAWGQGAHVEMAAEGRVRFLNIYGDGDEFRTAAFNFVTGYLSATR